MFVLFIIHITKKEKNEINVERTLQACLPLSAQQSADTAALWGVLFGKS